MTTQTESLEDLRELLAEEIPCGGIGHPQIARSCDRAAALMTRGHSGCVQFRSDKAFKCMSCWTVWYQHHAKMVARQGGFNCRVCARWFNTVESFADYRPF